MSQSLSQKLKGLYTSYNELSEVPEGALLEADNIDILQDSIAQPRRGFDRLATGYSNSAHRSDRLWYYQDKLMAHHGTLQSASTLSYYNSGTWTGLSGTYSAITSHRIRAVEASKNLLFTTSAGVKKLDAYNGTVKPAGAYKGLDLELTEVGSGSVLTSSGDSASYRGVWGYKDANNNYIVGAPTGIKTVTATGASKNVTVTLRIPSGVTTSWYYQVYRSSVVGTGITPEDELGLVYESSPSAGDITAGYVSFTDIVPDALRGASLYTNATQEGISQANDQPPLAKDIVAFQGHVFYLNVTSKHRKFVTMLAVGSPNGVQAADTITVGGVVYTAAASEDHTIPQFKVTTTGSASQNIRDTSESLVRVINKHASSTVYAYYISGPDDLPGMMLFEERSIGGAAFTAATSRTSSYSPNLTTDGSSENDNYPNGIMVSKAGQPEAVPLGNLLFAGSSDAEIYRGVALRTSLFIFKEDGIFRLSGTNTSNFQIEEFDKSTKLVGNETPAVLNNQIFCLTDQGVVSITESGVSVRSRPIEQDILSLFGPLISQIRSYAFGQSYESDRKYYLHLPSAAADTYPTQAYVYNTFTNAWTRHLLDATCATMDASTDKLYLGHAASNYVWSERKNYTYLDHADYGFAVNITAVSGTTVTLDSGTDLIRVGDIIYISSSLFAHVTAIDTILSQVTIDTNPGFTVTAATVLYAISTTVTWVPFTGGNPGIMKQFHAAELLFKADFNGTGYMQFKSDLSESYVSAAITGTGSVAWGLFNWGSANWGGEARKGPIRQWVPRLKQRCSHLTMRFTHNYGFSPWKLQGVTVFFEAGSERAVR
jgi:hypothetical protein